METDEKLGEEEEEGALSYGGSCNVCGYQYPNRRLRRSHLEHCGKALPAAAATTEAAAAAVGGAGFGGVTKREEGARERAAAEGTLLGEDGGRQRHETGGTLLGFPGGLDNTPNNKVISGPVTERLGNESSIACTNGSKVVHLAEQEEFFDNLKFTIGESTQQDTVVRVADVSEQTRMTEAQRCHNSITSISQPVPTGTVSEPQVSHRVHIYTLEKKLDMDSIEYLREKELKAREHDRDRKRQWQRFLILALQLLFFHGAIIFVDWAVLKLLKKEKILVLMETVSWFLFYFPIHLTKFWLDKEYSYQPTFGSDCLNLTVHSISYVAFHFLKESEVFEDHFSKLFLAHVVSFLIEFVFTSIVLFAFDGKADEALIDI